MNSKFIYFLIFAFAGFNIYADEANDAPKDTNGLRVNFKRVALDFSNTTVKNSEEYRTSSVSALNANDQTIMNGVFDFALEYEQPTYRWDNKIYATYGKVSITDNTTGEKTKSETADELSFTSDFSNKIWKYGQADIGAFTSLGYHTEFTQNEDAPRTKIVRAKGGLRLYNGKYFSDLYITNVFEEDFTYSTDISKYAIEIGANAVYVFKDNVKFHLEGYYRDYLLFSSYEFDDLSYDLNLQFRMETNMTTSIVIAPFVNLRQAKSRGADHNARNITIGISVQYAEIFNLFK